MPRRLRALNELRSVREAALFVRVAAFAVTVPLLLRLPLPRLAALLVRALHGDATPAPAEIERIAALVALAPRVAHPVIRTGCLTRGLTLFWFLRRAGVDVELRFGMDVGAGRAADGHCWLTLHGEPYLESADPRPRFAETFRMPVATA